MQYRIPLPTFLDVYNCFFGAQKWWDGGLPLANVILWPCEGYGSEPKTGWFQPSTVKLAQEKRERESRGLRIHPWHKNLLYQSSPVSCPRWMLCSWDVRQILTGEDGSSLLPAGKREWLIFACRLAQPGLVQLHPTFGKVSRLPVYTSLWTAWLVLDPP